MQIFLRVIKGISVFLIIISCFSCSGIEIVKRKHRPGWHVDISSKQKSKEQSEAPSPTEDIKEQQHRNPHTTIHSEANNGFAEELAITDSLPELNHSQESSNVYELQEFTQLAKKSSPNSINESMPPANKPKAKWPLLGFLAIAPLMALKFPFKSVSRWGAQNKFPAQASIVLASLVLGAFAFYSGTSFRAEMQEFVPAISATAMSAALLGLLFYPFGKANSVTYNMRKSLDAALLVSGVLLFFSQGILSEINPISIPGMAPKPSGSDAWLIVAEIALILLAIAVYLLLLFIVLALACNLSCSGNIAFANIVGIGGFLILTTLLVFAIRGIHRSLKKKRERYKGDEEFEPAEK